jgi:hypothetical protein
MKRTGTVINIVDLCVSSDQAPDVNESEFAGIV